MIATYASDMAISVEKLTEAALALPSEARALLADRLVESLDPVDDSVLQKLWATEAVRRHDEIRDGSIVPIPGPEGLEQVRKALRR